MKIRHEPEVADRPLSLRYSVLLALVAIALGGFVAHRRAQAANPDVNIVFVNQGEEARTIAAFLDRHGLALRNVLVDPQNSVGAALGHGGLPTTLFFDAHGRLAGTRIGELSQATLTQRLARIRATSPRAQ